MAQLPSCNTDPLPNQANNRRPALTPSTHPLMRHAVLRRPLPRQHAPPPQLRLQPRHGAAGALEVQRVQHDALAPVVPALGGRAEAAAAVVTSHDVTRCSDVTSCLQLQAAGRRAPDRHDRPASRPPTCRKRSACPSGRCAPLASPPAEGSRGWFSCSRQPAENASPRRDVFAGCPRPPHAYVAPACRPPRSPGTPQTSASCRHPPAATLQHNMS